MVSQYCGLLFWPVDMARHFALKDAIRLVGAVPHYLALPESFDFGLAAMHPHISPAIGTTRIMQQKKLTLFTGNKLNGYFVSESSDRKSLFLSYILKSLP